MAETIESKRIKRLIIIHRVVQALLIVLLVYMAVNFQARLQAEGLSHRFLHAIIFAVVAQLAVFWPVNKLAAADAARDVATAGNVPKEELQDLRKKRLFSDFIKTAVFIFFITFVARAPSSTFILAATFFTFIVITVTYFQCYNFNARKSLGNRS